jgi:hypothetical protein
LSWRQFRQRRAKVKRDVEDKPLSMGGDRACGAHYGEGVVLLAHTRGATVAGSGKGFAWRPAADGDAIAVSGDLDEAAAALPVKKALLLKKIDGNWRLQLEMR